VNDRVKTEMQETGRCIVSGMTVAEIAEIVASLGLDPRDVRVYGGVELVVFRGLPDPVVAR
jgi:predicted Holliday junction resolvase-like endonuclease